MALHEILCKQLRQGSLHYWQSDQRSMWKHQKWGHVKNCCFCGCYNADFGKTGSGNHDEFWLKPRPKPSLYTLELTSLATLCQAFSFTVLLRNSANVRSYRRSNRTLNLRTAFINLSSKSCHADDDAIPYSALLLTSLASVPLIGWYVTAAPIGCCSSGSCVKIELVSICLHHTASAVPAVLHCGRCVILSRNDFRLRENSLRYLRCMMVENGLYKVTNTGDTLSRVKKPGFFNNPTRWILLGFSQVFLFQCAVWKKTWLKSEN